MRKALAAEAGIRKKFRGVFARFGKKVSYTGYSEETILLQDIFDVEANQLVCDHLWFGYTKGFEKLNLREGVVLSFEARVKEYRKGYKNTAFKINHTTRDYKLSHPTKIAVFTKAEK
jgi:hypothetical protein